MFFCNVWKVFFQYYLQVVEILKNYNFMKAIEKFF